MDHIGNEQPAVVGSSFHCPSLEVNQDSAYDELDQIEHDLAQVTRSQSLPNIVNGANNQDTGSTEDAAELARRADEKGKQRVIEEIKRYRDDGTLKTSSMHNLLQFRQVNHSRYPLLYKVALDVLPAQASAVACERVFSSSKETDTNRRANLGPLKMEQLQIMRFGYRSQRVSFTDDLICSERELSVLDVPADPMRDLLERNEIKELDRLIRESWDGWGAAQSDERGLE